MNISLQKIFTGHVGANYSLEDSDKPEIFYSGSADRFVGSWNLEKGELAGPLARGTATVYSLWLDRINSTLYVGQRKGSVLIIDLTKEKPPRLMQAHHGDVFSVVLNGLGHVLTAGGDGHVKIWSQEDFKLLYDLHISTENIRCIHIAPNKNEFYTGASDHTARVYNMSDMTLKQVLYGHQNSVFTIQSIGDDRLITSGRDAMFTEWKREESEWKEVRRIPAHNYTVNHVALSPGGKILASGSRDKTIKLWDAQTLELLKVIDKTKYPEGHTHSVNRLLWKSDSLLISTGDDRKIISWTIS